MGHDRNSIPPVARMHSISILAAAVIFTGAVQAQTPPLEFKGLALGSATREQLLEKMPRFGCSEYGCSLAFRDISTDCLAEVGKNKQSGALCAPLLESYRFGPAVPAHFFVVFSGGKMVGVDLTIDGGRLTPYIDALSAKYGPPKVETEKLQNRMGAKFDKSIYAWKLPDGEIRAETYSGGLTNSRINLSAPGHDQASIAARAVERAKASAKPL